MSIHRGPAIPAIASPGASTVSVARAEFYDEDDGIPCSLLEAIFGIAADETAERPARKVLRFNRFGAMPWFVGVALLATALWVGA